MNAASVGNNVSVNAGQYSAKGESQLPCYTVSEIVKAGAIARGLQWLVDPDITGILCLSDLELLQYQAAYYKLISAFT